MNRFINDAIRARLPVPERPLNEAYKAVAGERGGRPRPASGRSPTSTYLFKYFFTYAMPSAALCIELTAKLPPCSTKKCVIPDMAAWGQIRV